MRGQDLEIVTMERRWLRPIAADRTSLLGCLCDKVSKRTPLLAALGRPIQAVLFPGIALELRRVHTCGLAVVTLERVTLLCGNICAARRDRVELVAPDPPRQHFFLAGGCIEAPSVRRFDERHREGPVL